MRDINRKISVGAFWNFASLMLSRGASTITMLFLAQIVAPEAFGLIAMSAVVFELCNTFINSGLGAAVVRSKSVNQVDLDTVFYTNIFLSVLAYIALYFLAPTIASFYQQFELTNLVRVMGLVVLFNAFKIVQVSVLSRDMNFKAQMKASTSGVVLSGGMAVVAALQGWGVWSLVLQMLSSALITTVILWLSSSWRPGGSFSQTSFLRFFGFGKNLLAEGVLTVLFNNSYILVIGRFFSAEITGLYFLATKINNIVSRQLSTAVQQSTFPALSTMQDDNPELLIKYRQIMQVMMFAIAPMMGLLSALAVGLFEVFFDEEWLRASDYLQLLCLAGVLYPIHALNVNLLNVKGRSDLVLKIGMMKKTLNLLLLFMALPYGVIGIVFSQVVGSILALIPNTYYSNRLIEYSLAAQVKDVAKPLGAAFLAAAAANGVYQSLVHPHWFFLIISALTGVAVYLLCCAIVKEEGFLMAYRKVIYHFNTKSN